MSMENKRNPPSPLGYLFRELKIRSDEWITLTDAEKDQLKAWAAEEIVVRRHEKEE